jgi:CubicO group peptidase (beta-lactamase class C family)
MEALDETFQAATRGPNRFTAGAVLTTANRDTTWTKSFGGVSAQDGAADMKDDTLMWVASCTKLMTTVAAMQCVEKGLFTLDENISRVLPEWKSPDILTGFDDKTGEPHSSGMGYDMFNPLLLALRKYQGREPGTLTGNIVSFCSNHQVGSTLAD